MPYARTRYRVPEVAASSLTGKVNIDISGGASLPTGNPDSVNLAFGTLLNDNVLFPTKMFPLHLREAFMRGYFFLKELRFPVQLDGSCVVMTTNGIYAGSQRLLSPVRPDYELNDDIETNMDSYGIAITMGADVVDYYGADSGKMKTCIVESLDFLKNNAGLFVAIP